MNVPGVISVRCHYCSKEYPAWRTHQLQRSQRICDYCLDWHNKAIEFLAGRGLPGCQVCGASWEFLHDSTLGVEVRMYVVPKDGIYQILCATCVRPYVSKRADLYGGTRFGTEALNL
jgi:hypothetical protein